MQMTNMKILPQYGTKVAVVPVLPDSAALREASREQLAVLIALLSESTFSYFSGAEKSGATHGQIDDAIRYWQNAGVISVEEAASTAASPTAETVAATAAVSRAAKLPRYNTDEAARFLEENPRASSLIDCCQQELGKIFTTAESEIIIGMMDYLSLNEEYILLLCAHCAKRNKKSLRYIEKLAISLHDEGIVTYDALEIHLKKRDMAYTAAAQLRKLFGIGKRALIKKEEKAFFSWTAEWEMPMDVITLAYEITVARTGEANISYTNAILEKWNAQGLRTLDDVNAAEEKRKNSPGGVSGSSFDTEDFFTSALKRSYEN